jgi:hypothetical protein
MRGWFRQYGDHRNVYRGQRYRAKVNGTGRWEISDLHTRQEYTGRVPPCTASCLNGAADSKPLKCYGCSNRAKRAVEAAIRKIGKGSRGGRS